MLLQFADLIGHDRHLAGVAGRERRRLSAELAVHRVEEVLCRSVFVDLYAVTAQDVYVLVIHPTHELRRRNQIHASTPRQILRDADPAHGLICIPGRRCENG